MVFVKAPEDVTGEWILLAHRLAKLLHHRLEVVLLKLRVGIVEQLLGVLVHVQHLKLMPIDLDYLSWHHVLWPEKLACDLIHVYSLLQELASDNAQVPLRRLVDGQTIVRKVETDDKDALCVFRLRVVETCHETQDLPLVREELDCVFPWLLRHQLQHRGHRIIPRAIASVGWRRWAWHSALWQSYVNARIQLYTKLLSEVLARENIRIVDKEAVVGQQGELLADPELAPIHILRLLLR